MKKLIALLLALTLFAALSVSVFAADFVSSVTEKPAPTTIAQTNAAGEQVDAVVTDAEGNEIASAPLGSIVVTPIATAEEASEETKEALSSAEADLKEKKLSEIIPNLTEKLAEIAPSMTEEDLAVRELFDIEIPDDVRAALKDGAKIGITFELNLNPGDVLIVLHKGANGWELIASDDVKINADGSVTVYFSDLSPIAFVTDSKNIAPKDDAPTSPATGVNTAPVALCVAGGLMVALCAYFVVRRKHTAAE